MAKLASTVDSYFTDESLATDTGPKATFVIGQLCAGKTTHRKKHCGGKFVLLDAGDVYLKLNSGSWTDFGKRFDGEMKQACFAIVGRAVMQKRSIVCELLVDNEETSRAFNAVRKGLGGLGYDIGIVDIDCDLETAKKRNAEREMNNISSYYTTSYHLNALLDVIKLKTSGQLESGTCDVCGAEARYPDGHLLTTRQVVGAPGYWEKVYGLNRESLQSRGVSSFDEFRKNSEARAELAERFAGETTPWMVCSLCISTFPVDASATHAHARQWWEHVAVYELPGVGPVPLSAVNMGDDLPSADAGHEASDISQNAQRRWWEFWKSSNKRMNEDGDTSSTEQSESAAQE